MAGARLAWMVVAGLASAPAGAGTSISRFPDWESTDVARITTGGALVDLDGDGWLDLVVANGNDMRRQPVAVYYNRGDGTLPPAPDWTSASVEYHGHLAVGDVNQDGAPDVAVGVFLGPNRFGDPGFAALYLNDGAGNLPATPSWVSADRFPCFGVALGDADGDGDLDLAAAAGDPYTPAPAANRVYYNRGGALDPSPGWLSDEVEGSLGVAWGDPDGDGDLDLAFSGTGAPHRVYYQAGGVLETTAGWSSDQPARFGIRVHFGDLDRDGYDDLAVAQNTQLGGSDGRFKVWGGGRAGLAPRERWASAFLGYGSELAIGDVNGDGWPDLLAGGWWEPIRIYRNRIDQPFADTPDWVSGTGSVVEALVLGDVDRDGLGDRERRFPADGVRKLFRLDERSLHRVREVWADGSLLDGREYCFDLAAGWVSVAVAPAAELLVRYTASERPDLAVTNWDASQGNFVMYARGTPVVLYATRGSSGTELKLEWQAGTSPFEVLESEAPGFGPGTRLRAEDLATGPWEDAPGTLTRGGLTLYRVH